MENDKKASASSNQPDKVYDYDNHPLFFRNFRSAPINVHGVWNAVYVVKSKASDKFSNWNKIYELTSTSDEKVAENLVPKNKEIINDFLNLYFPFKPTNDLDCADPVLYKELREKVEGDYNYFTKSYPNDAYKPWERNKYITYDISEAQPSNNSEIISSIEDIPTPIELWYDNAFISPKRIQDGYIFYKHHVDLKNPQNIMLDYHNIPQQNPDPIRVDYELYQPSFDWYDFELQKPDDVTLSYIKLPTLTPHNVELNVKAPTTVQDLNPLDVEVNYELPVVQQIGLFNPDAIELTLAAVPTVNVTNPDNVELGYSIPTISELVSPQEVEVTYDKVAVPSLLNPVDVEVTYQEEREVPVIVPDDIEVNWTEAPAVKAQEIFSPVDVEVGYELPVIHEIEVLNPVGIEVDLATPIINITNPDNIELGYNIPTTSELVNPQEVEVGYELPVVQQVELSNPDAIEVALADAPVINITSPDNVELAYSEIISPSLINPVDVEVAYEEEKEIPTITLVPDNIEVNWTETPNKVQEIFNPQEVEVDYELPVIHEVKTYNPFDVEVGYELPAVHEIEEITLVPEPIEILNFDQLLENEPINKPIIIEKEVPVVIEKNTYIPVEINRPFPVEKPIEVPVFIEKPIEVIKEIEKPVEIIKEIVKPIQIFTAQNPEVVEKEKVVWGSDIKYINYPHDKNQVLEIYHEVPVIIEQKPKIKKVKPERLSPSDIMFITNDELYAFNDLASSDDLQPQIANNTQKEVEQKPDNLIEAIELQTGPKYIYRRKKGKYISMYNGNKPLSSENILDKYDLKEDKLGQVKKSRVPTPKKKNK